MPMRSLWAIVAPVFLASVYLATAPAVPHAQETTENPFTTVLDARMGERLFRQQCGRCHGRDAKGGELGPDLTSGLQNASTDAGLFKVVREGLPNTQMIGISRSATDQSVWMVVSYLNSLNDTADVDLPGSATAGMQLFNGKGNCASCHMVSGEGGRRGPPRPGSCRSRLAEPTPGEAPPRPCASRSWRWQPSNGGGGGPTSCQPREGGLAPRWSAQHTPALGGRTRRW